MLSKLIDKIFYRRKLASYEVGELGEDIACAYLKSKGYKILNRNVKMRRNEIDIVATDNKRAIFVEVKTRTNSNYSAYFEVDSEKEERIRRASELFLMKRDVEDLERRYDVIEVYVTTHGKFISLEHHEGAF